MKKSLYTLGLIVLAACSENPKNIEDNKKEENIEFISYKDLQIFETPFEQFKLNNQKGAKVLLNNGGRIYIKPNSLVYADGSSVQGEYELKFEEYHGLADIVASGLPMRYDSAGMQLNFMSAGMFDIAASQNEKEIFIKKGEGIDVNLANFQDSKCYNFYELNEEEENWEYIKTDSPRQLRNKDVVLDVDVTYKYVDELKDRKIIAWKLLDEDVDPAKISGRARSVRSLPDNTYSIKYVNSELPELWVEPIYLEDMETNGDVQFDNYNKKKNDAQTVRYASVKRFGSYNWDKVMNVPEYFEEVSTMAFPYFSRNEYTVKLLVYKYNGIFETYPSEKSRLPLKLDSKLCLIATSIYGDVAILGNQEIQDFIKGKVPELAKFNVLDKKFSTGEELEELLEKYI